jgi:hypothetical protein
MIRIELILGSSNTADTQTMTSELRLALVSGVALHEFHVNTHCLAVSDASLII